MAPRGFSGSDLGLLAGEGAGFHEERGQYQWPGGMTFVFEDGGSGTLTGPLFLRDSITLPPDQGRFQV